jgi:putative DNA primase/helicase
MTCREAGSPHKGGGAGESQIIDDNGAIFHAWLYAKKNGYIPEDDKIPVKAMHYIAKKHLGHKAKDGEMLPPSIYYRVLGIVEDAY